MAYLSIFLLFALPATFGVSALAAARLGKEKITLLLAGTIVGLALLVTSTHLIMLLVPLSRSSLLVLLLALTTSTAWLLTKTNARKHWQTRPLDRTALIVLLLMTGLFSLIAPKLLFTQAGGLSTGIVSAYGDLGWHLANITSLQDNSSFIPEDPIMAGEKLKYPPLANLFSAMLLTAGASFVQSVVIPALVLIPLTLTLLYCFTREFAGLRQAGIIALLLFLFGGATLGWLYLPDDWQAAGQPLSQFLADPPRSYTGSTNADNQLNLLNPIVTLLLPQRPFLFGMPLAFTVLLLLHKAKPRHRRPFIAAGLAAGLVPLFHAHTALALAPAIIALAAIKPSKQWLYFFAAAAIAGLPSLLYYRGVIDEPGTFLTYKLGWMSAPDNWVVYWLKNSGFLLPAALLGLMAPAPKAAKALAAAGLILFAAANIWLFAVWEWDNTKIFAYWLLLTLPLSQLGMQFSRPMVQLGWQNVPCKIIISV